MKSPESVVLAGSLVGGLILGGPNFERLIMGLTREYSIYYERSRFRLQKRLIRSYLRF